MAALTFVLPSPAAAAMRTYSIVQAESQVTISGEVAGFDIVGQGGGGAGLTTSYTGSIVADRTETTIQFLGTTMIDAEISGTWEPAVGGDDGSAPADYGGTLDLGILGDANVAIRDLVATVASDPLSISSGGFDLSGVAFSFVGDSAFDFNYNILFEGSGSGRESLVDEDLTENLNGTGTLGVDNLVETLTIPIDVTIEFENLNDVDLLDGSLQLTGQLVATATLPSVPGDFDGDGDVDGADFVVWQTNFPTETGATLATGDADGDGDVDGADFVIWQTNFPFTPSPAASPVPEPASWMLALILGGSALAVRCRRHAGAVIFRARKVFLIGIPGPE